MYKRATQKRIAICLVSIVCWFAPIATAESSEAHFKPADIFAGESSLLNTLNRASSRPEKDGKLKCETRINAEGRYRNTYCYLNDDSMEKHLQHLMVSLERARAKPGEVNGRRKTTWLQFTMTYKVATDTYSIKQNLENDDEKFGVSYRAAQRYKTPRNCSSSPKQPIVVAYKVDHLGNIGDIHITPSIEEKKLAKRIKGCFSRMKFFPAYRDGKPVDSAAVEPMFHGASSKRIKSLNSRGGFNCNQQRC